MASWYHFENCLTGSGPIFSSDKNRSFLKNSEKTNFTICCTLSNRKIKNIQSLILIRKVNQITKPIFYNFVAIMFANKFKPATGRLLLSEPFLLDPVFRRSVILLTKYDKEGAVGFVLNKPLNLTLQE